MKKMNKKQQNFINQGPIPGENYTSDTRNYPWHRPPDIIDPDEIVEFVLKRSMKPRPASGILTMLEMGITITEVTQMLVIAGMGGGKWTINAGLIAAGPIARGIEMMAKNAKIKYERGFEEDETMITPPPKLSKTAPLDVMEQDAPIIEEKPEEVPAMRGGFLEPKE